MKTSWHLLDRLFSCICSLVLPFLGFLHWTSSSLNMNSTEKETHGILLCEETIMNGDLKKVHSDRLKTQSESQKSCCSSKMYCSLSLFAILNILVCMDVFIRLKLTSFGILLFCIFHFLRIARDLAVQPNKVPPALDVERILGEIIHSFWVTDVVGNKGTLSYLIVKYTFEGVTYQATYLQSICHSPKSEISLWNCERSIKILFVRSNCQRCSSIKNDCLSAITYGNESLWVNCQM